MNPDNKVGLVEFITNNWERIVTELSAKEVATLIYMVDSWSRDDIK